jgi:hypothetical protein
MKQTYFEDQRMSRNGYAVICDAEIIFNDQSDFVRSIAPQSIPIGDQYYGFVGTIDPQRD